MTGTGLHAENIFRSLLDTINTPSTDMSKHHAGLKRVNTGPFHYYKLSTDTSLSHDAPVNAVTGVKYKLMTESEKETARIAIAEHHNKPVDETPMETVKHNEKVVLYGDNSPIRDEAVLLAWKKAREAERKLSEHRAYMKKLAGVREDISHIKENDPRINQIDSDK